MSALRLVFASTLALACTEVAPTPLDAAMDAIVDARSQVDALTDARDVRRGRDAADRCPDGSALPYPVVGTAIDLGVSLPDLRFEAESGSISLRDWYTPCEARPRLLIVRTLAAWSGHSQYAAAHTSRVLGHPMAARFTLVDLVALDDDNLPASRVDLAAWRRRYDRPPAVLAADPGYQLKALYASVGQLPLYAFIDPRDMRVVRLLPDPSSAEVAWSITDALLEIDGMGPVNTPPETRFDGLFTLDQWEMIRAMGPVTPPPADPTNRVADDPRAAALGERLFNDRALSVGGDVSCATCHARDLAFADGRPRAIGAAAGDRNTPTVLGAAYSRWLFWDGRVDTLWAQALGPVENSLEMASSRLALAHRVESTYAEPYVALFGPLPALSDRRRFPERGRPGEAAWEAMSAADQEATNRVYVNAGKAMAAFERTLRPPPSALDRYAMGDTSALSVSQREGLHHFFTGGCAQCHYGPMLSDHSFHNIGMPTGRRDGLPDRGRVDVIAALGALPFRSDGPFSDDRTRGAHLDRLIMRDSQIGQFLTPTLRQTSRTGPWGHGGTFPTLVEVVRHYSNGTTRPPVDGTIGERDLHLPAFHMTESTIMELASLLEAM